MLCDRPDEVDIAGSESGYRDPNRLMCLSRANSGLAESPSDGKKNELFQFQSGLGAV